jgi:hypothetical protein
MLRRIFISMAKSRKMRWTGHVACTGWWKMHTEFWSGNRKRRDNSEDKVVNGKKILEWILGKWWSRNSSVGTALGCELDDRSSRVRFPARAGNFSLHHRVQNGSGAHSASYPMGTISSFPGGKAAGAWSWPLTSIYCRSQRMYGDILSLPNTPSWRGAELK